MPRHANATSFGQKSGNPPGRGPLPGAPNAGRPPHIFVKRLDAIMHRQKVVQQVEEILQDKDHPHFAKVLGFAADRTAGPVPKSFDVTTGGQPLTVRIVRDDA